MTSLVTGGGGFLGRYVVELLVARGGRVRSFSRRRHDALDLLAVEQHTGDLRDAAAVAAACDGIEVVYHVAAVAGIWGPWSHYYDINTVGTRHVIEACLQQGVRKLIYTSSPSVTFDANDQCGVDETAPYATRWLCHYPHTKALAEQEVLGANGYDELLTCALRPHLIWGPRDEHLIPRLIAKARAGRLRRVGDGRNLIDMVYVENAAHAHLQAANVLSAGSPVAGRAYFISQGEPVSCWAWIDEILQLAGMPAVDKAISAKAAWRVRRGLRGPLRPAAAARRAADDPLSRSAAQHITLLRYLARPARFRLRAADQHRRGHAPAGRSDGCPRGVGVVGDEA